MFNTKKNKRKTTTLDDLRALVYGETKEKTIEENIEKNFIAPPKPIEKVDFTDVIGDKKDKKPKRKKISKLEIKPIITMENSFEEPPNDILLPTPFSMLMIAKPGSGKSTTLLNMLQWYDGYFDRVYVISPTIGIDSSWVKAIKDKLINVKQENIFNDFDEDAFKKIFEEIKRINDGVMEYPKKLKTLFIFDDIVGDMPKKQRSVVNNFARNHRHYGISHITLSQEYNAVPPVLRKNSYGLCLFDSDNGLERNAIIKNMGGKIGLKTFENMWNDITKKKFSFLYVKPFESDLTKKYHKGFDNVIDIEEYKKKKDKYSSDIQLTKKEEKEENGEEIVEDINEDKTEN